MKIKTFEGHSLGELEYNIQLFLDDINKVLEYKWNTVILKDIPHHYIMIVYE